ncbi:MAG: hypothetical protein ACI9OJ_004418 [Myxococcota bacterium]|jgi:hypothetical protein
MMKTASRLCFALLLAATLAPAAAAASSNTGLVTQVTAGVTYRLPVDGASAAAVRAFMKARSGDVYSLPANSTLRIVYFDSGRQEVWTGPAEFVIGTDESVVRSGGSPAVTMLPAAGTRGIRRVPSLLKRSGVGRLGAVRVRGADDEGIQWRMSNELSEREVKAFADARAQYVSLQKLLGPGDPTPDFYLIGVVGRLRLRAELEEAVSGALLRFPKEETLTRIQTWLKPPAKPASKDRPSATTR